MKLSVKLLEKLDDSELEVVVKVVNLLFWANPARPGLLTQEVSSSIATSENVSKFELSRCHRRGTVTTNRFQIMNR